MFPASLEVCLSGARRSPSEGSSEAEEKPTGGIRRLATLVLTWAKQSVAIDLARAVYRLAIIKVTH